MEKNRERSSSFGVSLSQSHNVSSDFLFLRKLCWRLWTNPWGVVCSLYCGVTNQVNCVVTAGFPSLISPLPPSGRRSLIVFHPSHDTQRRRDGSCGALLCPIRQQNWFPRDRLATCRRIRRTSTLSEKHAGTLAGRDRLRAAADSTLGVKRLMMLSCVLHRAEPNIPQTWPCAAVSFSCCMEFPSHEIRQGVTRILAKDSKTKTLSQIWTMCNKEQYSESWTPCPFTQKSVFFTTTKGSIQK